MALSLRHLLVSALAFVALALALPGAASASGYDVLADCFDDGELQGQHSEQDLRDARNQLAADQDNYSECRDIIGAELQPKARTSNDGVDDGDEADQAGGANGNGSGVGDSAGSSVSGSEDSTGSGPVSPEEEARKRQIARADTERQLGDDRAFDPRDGAAIAAGDTSNGLSLPLLLALIALTLLLAAGVLMAVHQRNPAFMGALRRVPLPRRRR